MSRNTEKQPALIDLTVGDLKQFAYCPRVVYFRHVLPVRPSPTYKMEHGKMAQARMEKLERRRTLFKYGLEDCTRHFNVRMYSEKLGLSGLADLVLESSQECYPVDFKETESEPMNNHLLQLAGYGLLAEEHFGKAVRKGYIFLIGADEARPFELGGDLKGRVVETLKEIRRMIISESMPGPTEMSAKCEQCEYRNFCGDVF